jgi:signal transduction histidine kinase
VPAAYRRLIWERFERGANRLNASVPGTGIGLALVRSLVEAHGGRVQYVDSQLIGGACFVVEIPDQDLVGARRRRRLAVSSGQTSDDE